MVLAAAERIRRRAVLKTVPRTVVNAVESQGANIGRKILRAPLPLALVHGNMQSAYSIPASVPRGFCNNVVVVTKGNRMSLPARGCGLKSLGPSLYRDPEDFGCTESANSSQIFCPKLQIWDQNPCTQDFNLPDFHPERSDLGIPPALRWLQIVFSSLGTQQMHQLP